MHLRTGSGGAVTGGGVARATPGLLYGTGDLLNWEIARALHHVSRSWSWVLSCQHSQITQYNSEISILLSTFNYYPSEISNIVHANHPFLYHFSYCLRYLNHKNIHTIVYVRTIQRAFGCGSTTV